MRNFVRVLAQYGRITLLPEISSLYELMKANHEKTVHVEVTSAFDISEAEASQLADGLARHLQQEIELDTSVDGELLGGVVIRAEDTVIDHSVRGKLRKLSQALS